AGSSKSVRPLPSSSMQLPHISVGAAFGTRHVLVWTHTPPMQASIVQALKSLQLAAVVQGMQPLTAAWWQTPASQVSVVQALWSSQSVTVVQGVQPGMGAFLQTPATHDSKVQASSSLQSAAVAQGLQPEPESSGGQSAPLAVQYYGTSHGPAGGRQT